MTEVVSFASASPKERLRTQKDFHRSLFRTLISLDDLSDCPIPKLLQILL